MNKRLVCLVFAAAVAGIAAEKYTGPRPAKTDVPYLLHAGNLLETETAEAREENRKDNIVAVVPGAASSARTPLAEPIFVIRTDKLVAEKIQLYRMEVKTGNREVLVSSKKGKNVPRPVYLNVRRLDDRLYQIEVDQILENGEYTLSPDGSNQTFSFSVF